jgi:ATP-binding cassette subfamily B protein
MRKIFQYLKPYRLRMTLGMVTKIVGTMAELVIPYILSYMIDDVIPRQDERLIYLWGGVMILCAMIALAFNIIANRMASLVSRNCTEAIRNDLFGRIMYLSSRQMDQITLPSMISRLTTDTYNVHQMLGMMQRMGVRAPILFLGGILITFTLDPVLTLVMLSVAPVIVVIVVIVSKFGIPMYTRLQKRIDEFVRVVREDVSGIRIIKALSKEEYEKQKFDTYNRRTAEQEQKAGLVMGALNPGVNVCLNAGTVLVIYVGAMRVSRGQVQPGVLIAFLSYVTLILNAILFVSRMLAIFSRADASAKRINEVLEMPMELQAEESRLPQEQGNPSAETPWIEFDHVTFSYHKKEPNVEDISFSLEKGQTLGILGATGSGKSTIVQLLLRFYDADEGVIRIQGKDVRSYSPTELHGMFGVVFQNDFITRDSIAENIRFGRDLTEEDIHQAALHAQADEFIQGKEEGYDTLIAVKGADMSGGQKQRLLISRALASHPDILVLDDSMSALDYKTDAALREAIRTYYADTTAVIVAQRISSVMHADKILVLDEGKMVGYGSNEELLQNCEIYQDIYRIQTGREVKSHAI